MADIDLMIKISEEIYKQIMEFGFLENTHGKICYKAIKNGTLIPDNATNADVIRTLFPDGIPKDIVWTLQGDKGANWWNAPYQKGGKE